MSYRDSISIVMRLVTKKALPFLWSFRPRNYQCISSKKEHSAYVSSRKSQMKMVIPLELFKS